MESNRRTEGQINAAVRKAQKGELRPIMRRKTEKTYEVRAYLPEVFVDRYEELLDLIFGSGRGYGSPGKMDLAGKGKGSQISENYFVTDGGLKSEKAMMYRKLIDHKLRTLSREMRDWMEGKDRKKKGTKNCSVCGKFVSRSWIFCAWCGLDLED